MTTTSFVAAPSNTTDALFRAWGSALSAALAAVGMVKATDTGQINWTTVPAPTVINTQAGYEIWRFADTLQATVPIFLRIGYGSGTAIGLPSLWVTIGKGSDGAGTITGVLQAQAQVAATSGSATTFVNWYVSSVDGSTLAIAPALAWYAAQTTSSWWLALERSRTSAGAATGTGLMFTRTVGVAFPTTTGYNYAAPASWANARFPVGIPASTGSDVSLATGGKAPLFAAVCTDGLGTFWQPRSVLVGMRTDVGSGSAITVPGFGTYMPMGAAGQGCDAFGGIYATACLAYS